MYTGTLITDLMATVERAERTAKQQSIAEQRELERLFELEIPFVQLEPALVGAA